MSSSPNHANGAHKARVARYEDGVAVVTCRYAANPTTFGGVARFLSAPSESELADAIAEVEQEAHAFDRRSTMRVIQGGR